MITSYIFYPDIELHLFTWKIKLTITINFSRIAFETFSWYPQNVRWGRTDYSQQIPYSQVYISSLLLIREEIQSLWLLTKYNIFREGAPAAFETTYWCFHTQESIVQNTIRFSLGSLLTRPDFADKPPNFSGVYIYNRFTWTLYN